MIADNRVDAAVLHRLPERFAVDLGSDRRIDLTDDAAGRRVGQRQVMQGRLEPNVEMRMPAPAVGAARDRLGAREME